MASVSTIETRLNRYQRVTGSQKRAGLDLDAAELERAKQMIDMLHRYWSQIIMLAKEKKVITRELASGYSFHQLYDELQHQMGWIEKKPLEWDERIKRYVRWNVLTPKFAEDMQWLASFLNKLAEAAMP